MFKVVEIVVDHEKCTGCGICVEICPVKVYELQNGISFPANVEECIVCRKCEERCPEGAIQVTGKRFEARMDYVARHIVGHLKKKR